MNVRFFSLPTSLLILNIAISLLFFRFLPNPAPFGFLPNGEPLRYVSSWYAAGFFPLLSFLAYVFSAFASKYDPQLQEWRRRGAIGPVLSGILLGLLVANTLMLIMAIGVKSLVPYHSTIMMIVVGMLLLMIGNYQTKWASQGFWAIATPWMRHSESIKLRTDRLFSRLYLVSGCCLLLASLLTLHRQSMFFWGYFPMNLPVLLMLAAIVFPFSIGYGISYWYYLEETKRLS